MDGYCRCSTALNVIIVRLFEPPADYQVNVNFIESRVFFEHLTEVAVIVSLFIGGFKLRLHFYFFDDGLVWYSRHREFVLFNLCAHYGSCNNIPDSVGITLFVVTLNILIHGISIQPILNFYARAISSKEGLKDNN